MNLASIARSGLVVICSLLAPFALADWETDVKITGTNDPLHAHGSGPASLGKAYMKGSKLRMDTNGSPKGNLSLIFDHEAKKMLTIQHDAKRVIELNMGDLGALSGGKEKDLYANCNPKEGATRCLSSMGYKKTGAEKVNGFDCEIYERTSSGTDGGNRTKIWHPRGMEEVPSIRVVHTGSDGHVLQQIDFLNLQSKPVADTVFAIPAGYKKQDMGGMLRGLMQGFGKGGGTQAE